MTLTKKQFENARDELKAEIDTNQQCIDDLRAEDDVDEDDEDEDIEDRECVNQRLWWAMDALAAYERVVALLKSWEAEPDAAEKPRRYERELHRALEGK